MVENVVTEVGHKHIFYPYIKAFFDLIIGLIGVILLIPIALVVKIVSMLSGDFGKIFYTQERIGKNGKIFKLYKFRSMVPNADEELKKLLKQKKYREEYEKNHKFEHDPRITKIGNILRKTSLDEFPQFINIFKGDMSLVGNRPYMPSEKKDMCDYYNDIIKTRPGLTGYWQVSGRSNITFKDRLKLEKFYSENCGLRFDIKIIFKTIKVVLCKKGAK